MSNKIIHDRQTLKAAMKKKERKIRVEGSLASDVMDSKADETKNLISGILIYALALFLIYVDARLLGAPLLYFATRQMIYSFEYRKYKVNKIDRYKIALTYINN